MLLATWLGFNLYDTSSFVSLRTSLLPYASPRTSLHVQRRFTLLCSSRRPLSLTNISLLAALRASFGASLGSQLRRKYLLHFSMTITSLHNNVSVTRPSRIRPSCVAHASGFLETTFEVVNASNWLTIVINMYRIWNFSKMLIWGEVITTSGFLETIFGGREQSRWICQGPKHA